MPEPKNEIRPLFIPLKYRFILMITLMLILLLGALILVLNVLQSRTIKTRIKSQGLFIAQNLAMTSRDDLVTYNYIALEKAANQAAEHPDVIHVVIHDKEGKIAGFSNRPDLQNRTLTDEISLLAVSAQTPQTHEGISNSATGPTMTIIFPVFLKDKKTRWGTIRVQLTLAPMNQQIRQTQWTVLGLGFIALIGGILFANLAAGRITAPLRQLMDITKEASQGNLKQDINIPAGDEVGVLASNFSIMVKELLTHKTALEEQLEEIHQLQQYSEKILDTMGDGLLSVTREKSVKQLNPAARKILNISQEITPRGLDISQVLSHTPELHDAMVKILDDPGLNRQQEITILQNKEPRVILMGFGVLDAQNNRSVEVIFNLHDITELKQLESRMRQSQRLADIGIIAAGLAHEIRNPLSAIKTFAGLLPQKVNKPGFLDKFQRTVPREINRLNGLVEELLELARTPNYNFTMINAARLLNDIVDLIEVDLDASDIVCVRNFGDNLGEIRADGDQLAKVFHNLIRNAAQVMPQGGTLTLEALRDNDKITIAVKDTGPGMPRETLSTIFTPFFTTKHKGTGLGLAITQKVVSEHGGDIKATSVQDQGSCFTVTLPADAC
ncbi:two-component system, NtrC family, sensor histidine kinase AtoS [Desulfocicer vacuolatum DSM 3385]|uniref:histidine kinase n=1 Tax=Desulfocicer vacuolatum DSM 3385 TaxID=1121400 RepID=A0A1W2D0I7_9BACT|nr:ATP-binding protein [Desulfocicer vacuolatum]SMC90508.1 two-component system, NtrC family, sensor histidine kinase AtoS [Desulfocicer vacuolatum DSM 3385]